MRSQISMPLRANMVRIENAARRLLNTEEMLVVVNEELQGHTRERSVEIRQVEEEPSRVVEHKKKDVGR